MWNENDGICFSDCCIFSQFFLIGGDLSLNVCDLTHIAGLRNGVRKSMFRDVVCALGPHSIYTAVDG